MRQLVFVLLLTVVFTNSGSAQFGRHKKPSWPNTEGEMVHKLAQCLHDKDSVAYYHLFPPFDTLWHMVIHNSSRNPEVLAQLNKLKEHPQSLIEFDPMYNRSIMSNFFKVLEKGQDSGLRWSSSVVARYELHKQFNVHKSLIGFEQIAPERFSGFIFIRDKFNRATYCMSVGEVQKIKGKFFGGQVYDILEASTVDEFYKMQTAEIKYLEWRATHPDTIAAQKDSIDSVSAAIMAKNPLMLDVAGDYDDDDDNEIEDLQVVDRKYYEGLMDNKIPIKLYIRYMRDFPGKPHQYDGLYKLDENKTYLRIFIRRDEKGNWLFEDELALGTMELTLKGDTYTGSWANANDNGYTVEVKETGTPEGKIEHLDRILDVGISGYVEENWFGPTKRERRRAARKEKRQEKKEEKQEKKKEKNNDKKATENGKNDKDKDSKKVKKDEDEETDDTEDN